MAILENEPEANRFADFLRRTPDLVMGAPTRFELSMVAFSRKGETGLEVIRHLLDQYTIEIREWSDSHVSLALDAFMRFGKGNHAAKLNFGDCMAYALAKSLDAPLLFKGDDFAKTDVKAAL